MSFETEPPFSHGVTPKVFASILGKRVEWVWAQIRLERIPTLPDLPGRRLIDPNYANRVLKFRIEIQKTA